MPEISKKFDGVLWEWKGRKYIKDLKPICPKCKYELDFEMSGGGIRKLDMSVKITLPQVAYLCSKCGFPATTNIDGVDKVEDLRKAVLKEFEHRVRIKAV
jgi:coproporphyrinogen III oxidase-like Fe-S oxidoreductase